MDLSGFAEAVGTIDHVAITGLGTRGGAPDGVRCVAAPGGIEWIQADEMTVACGAGTAVDELASALSEVGQRVVLPEAGTVGGALAHGRSGVRRLGDGPLRDALLQTRYIGAHGSVVKAGGPTVKNVSGFDVCRLLVGSRGTLGFLGDVILRTRPLPATSQWFTSSNDPRAVLGSIHRPISVLWDGTTVWVLLEGHPRDVETQAERADLVAGDGPPPLPAHRCVVAPAAVADAVGSLAPGSFVVEVGAGVVHAPVALPAPEITEGVARLAARVKQQFDPAGRLNPGVVVGR